MRTAIPIPTRAGTASAPAELTADRITKSLLGYGVLAGPVFVLSSLTQATLRDGFDLGRHAWSQLALGEHGWVQVVTFLLTGAMALAAALGWRRALSHGPAAIWAPRLLAVFGAGLVVAGIFPVDPMGGFPVGTPAPDGISTSAVVHLLAGAIGFPALAAALIVAARRLAAEGSTRLAIACRVVGPAFVLSFLLMATGVFGAAGIPVFVLGVSTALGLLALLSLHRYRLMPDTCGR